MVVGGTMKHHVGAFFFENRVDSFLVADVGQARADIRADPALAELAINLEECVFGALEQDQTARTEFHGLAADFRADGASGAGDEDGFTGEEALEFGCVETNGLAAEELEDIDARRVLSTARIPPLVNSAP